MSIDFSKLLKSTKSDDIEPRDIFMALPGKDKKYEYPRDVQSDVWKKWFECRDNKNNIIKMNTGSGKTTVARALQKKFGYNTMMISQDEIRGNILWVKDGVDTKALPLMIELMKYGYEHCDVVILEGIMYDEWYSPLFKTANELYGMDIYAYYFDIPFEETVRRHNTRDKKQEFGEEDMRRWWREKDFSSVFNEKTQ